jgi:prophage tail gpP-like protein
MLTVDYKITIGSTAYTTAGHTRLSRLRVQAALEAPLNTARIILAPPDGLDVALDDDVTVELGYDGNLEQVFAGKVDTVEYRIDGLHVHACGSFRQLLAARFNLFYEKSSASDIVSDLCSRLSLQTGQVDSGLDYPYFALSATENVYQGLHHMASQCGVDLYADVEDKLVFAAYTGAVSHDFQYGVNVLTMQLDTRNPLVTGAAIYGESPASLGQGSDAASWLTKKEIQGQAGDSSGQVARRFDATARTQDMAAQIAQAVVPELGAKRACTLNVLGAAEVQLGHALNVSHMPLGAQNGKFKVMGVEHRLDRRQGFITLVRGLGV